MTVHSTSYIFLTLLFGVLSADLSLAQDALGHASSGASAIDYIAFNNASIRRGDVLVHHRQSVDHLDGIRTVDTYTRLMFSLDEQKLAQFSVAAAEEATSVGTRSGDAINSTLVVEKKAWRKRWPNPGTMQSFSHDGFTQACLENGCVPFGLVGLQHYSSPSIPKGDQASIAYDDYCDYWWTNARSLANQKSDRHLTIGPFKVGSTGTSRLVEILLDPQSRFPRSKTTYLVIKGKNFLNSKETFVWEDAESGHILPKSSTLDEFVPIQSSSDDTMGTQVTAIGFHWFSVNENLDESLFDLSSIADGKLAQRLTDPVLSGASSLLEN